MFNKLGNLCRTCLSSDRKLQSVKMFENSLSPQMILDFQLNIKNDMICWECEAIIKKLLTFRQQAIKAKEALNWVHNTHVKTLSSLQSCISTHSYDDNVTIKIEPVEYTDNNGTVSSPEPSEEITNEFTIKKLDCIKKSEPIEQNEIEDMKIPIFEINVKKENSNKKNSKIVNYTENKFIVKVMNEQEMLDSRTVDKEVAYYKNCPFKCENCILGYHHKNTFEKHLKDKHSKEGGKYMCDICKVWFAVKQKLSDHLSAHYKHYTCKLCSNAHHNLKIMMQHYTNIHDSRTYVCKVCNNEYPTWRALRYHREAQHKDKPKCDQCGRTFPNTTNLKRHMLVHANSPLVECPVCHKKYKDWTLKAHMRFHNPNMATEAAYCAECGIQFRNVMLYKSHLKKSDKHISNDVKKHICQDCGKRFTDRIFLKRHYDGVHLKKRDHVCHICCKMYNKADSLRRHIRQAHEGQGRLKDKLCHICNKAFTYKTQLREHVNSHTGERPYSCGQCSASFGYASALYMHTKLIHLKPNKQHCDQPATATTVT